MKNQISEIKENQIVVSPSKKETKKETKSKKTVESVIEEKIGISKDSIYIYPLDTKGNIKKEKSFRTSRRNTLKGFVNLFLLETEIKKNKEYNFQETFDKFLSFYKGNYRTNDFSVSSLRETISDFEKSELEKFLNACKAQIAN